MDRSKSDIVAIDAIDDFIEHYGKLGMKWGKTSSKISSALTSNQSKSRSSADHTTVVKIQAKEKAGGKPVLSNKQLQTAITRINLEKQYKTLNPTTVDKGKSYAKKAQVSLTTVASLYALSQSPFGKAIKNKLVK